MNDNNAPFYLAVNNCKKQDSSKPWFKKSAVGVNKLNSLMKQMAEKAGLGSNVKNHSGRKTMIQTLTNNDIPATDIIQLSGHKNLQSVTNYSVVSEKLQVKMSRTLSELMSGNVHSLEKLIHLKLENAPLILQLARRFARRQIITNKRCRFSRALLFMEVNSAFLLTALINPRCWQSKKLRRSLLQRGTKG